MDDAFWEHNTSLLDCMVGLCLRGIDSFIRMGTTSFFAVIWFSILSTIAMVGFLKFLVVLFPTGAMLCSLYYLIDKFDTKSSCFLGIFVGFAFAILVIAISGAAFLWFYGNFWMTMLIIFLGGLAFILSHERVALSITTLYSVYCAWVCTGWLGLLLGLNLSFISSDALIYVLKNNMNEHRRSNRYPEQTTGMQDQSSFSHDDPCRHHLLNLAEQVLLLIGVQAHPTSGADSEISSEDEVVRLLNCSDHYAALGLSRYENIDTSYSRRSIGKR
ncbi:hypothetical protein Csa_021757 [Cucumis sativus]|uniref:Uncharacterized protein n=1 Tax=Cucumis sativus TaxID=3659 RepID=A0ACB6HBA0_CUCSA|nr:hypothetical protein CSA_004597 [Cucumis sativus]KAE8647146.1 hypothetical protein Csa_021757 [Cucumis sativus]